MQKSSHHPSPDVSRATRGRFLARHKARVIEQDDLVIVEFVEQDPWYTAAPRRKNGLLSADALLPRLLTLMLVVVTSSASALYGVGKWLRWI
ncbi:MAG: hypothetical protein H7145_11805 [Akkermansiaceae bacterium]|nr:hypothetical protein [Armatimonadota bacterium]